MTDPDARARLTRCGEALFGPRWQSDLARALDVGDRRVREWVAGERSIPAGVWADLRALLKARAGDAQVLVRELARL